MSRLRHEEWLEARADLAAVIEHYERTKIAPPAATPEDSEPQQPSLLEPEADDDHSEDGGSGVNVDYTVDLSQMSDEQAQRLLLTHDKMILMRASSDELSRMQLKTQDLVIGKPTPPFAPPFRLLFLFEDQIVADSLCTQLIPLNTLDQYDIARLGMTINQIWAVKGGRTGCAWRVAYFHMYYRPSVLPETVSFPPKAKWIRWEDGMLTNK